MGNTFTSGPWHTEFDLDTKTCDIYTADHYRVATTGIGNNGEADDNELVANAHLIAAAPDLLNTCQYVLGMLREKDGLRGVGFSDEIQELEATIAKAEGDTRYEEAHHAIHGS